jgi:hypothetical protein
MGEWLAAFCGHIGVTTISLEFLVETQLLEHPRYALRTTVVQMVDNQH